MVRRKIVDGVLSGEYPPGSRIPTEREMAELSSTSRVTVRRAYERLEKAGIICRRPSAGTRVSSSFGGASGEGDGQVAVLASLRDPFALDFIAKVNALCDEADLVNVLAVTEGSGEAQAEKAVSLAAKGVREMIVWGLDRSFDLSIYERLRVLGVNLVFFDRVEPGPSADYVGLDNADAAKHIARFAKEEGAVSAVYLDYATLDADGNRARREAVKEAFARLKTPFLALETPYPARPKEMKALAAALNASGAPAPRAAVCVNDALALALEPHLEDSVKLYSFDGSEEAFENGIASYSQPVHEMAAACVKLLEEQRRLGPKWRAGRHLFKGSLRLPSGRK
jgi:DNA-binding LacI/PurR family transcriptional regulator